MTLDKNQRAQMLRSCAELTEEDGVDPAEVRRTRRRGRDRRRDYKARQLCRQVAQTLDLTLSGEFHDSLLQSLHVLEVSPTPDGGQLLVTLCADLPAGTASEAELLHRVERVAGVLRSHVAAAITRRRTPRLKFVVRPVRGADRAEATDA